MVFDNQVQKSLFFHCFGYFPMFTYPCLGPTGMDLAYEHRYYLVDVLGLVVVRAFFRMLGLFRKKRDKINVTNTSCYYHYPITPKS